MVRDLVFHGRGLRSGNSFVSIQGIGLPVDSPDGAGMAVWSGYGCCHVVFATL